MDEGLAEKRASQVEDTCNSVPPTEEVSKEPERSKILSDLNRDLTKILEQMGGGRNANTNTTTNKFKTRVFLNSDRHVQQKPGESNKKNPTPKNQSGGKDKGGKENVQESSSTGKLGELKKETYDPFSHFYPTPPKHPPPLEEFGFVRCTNGHFFHKGKCVCEKCGMKEEAKK